MNNALTESAVLHARILCELLANPEGESEKARAIIVPALKLMIAAVHHYDGFIVQSTGDGIFALFGAPVAHEDQPP